MAVVGAVGIFFCVWVAILALLATRNPTGCLSVTFYRFAVHVRRQTGIARVAARVAKTAATNCFQPVPGRRTVNSSLLVDRWSVRVSGDTMCVSSTCAALLTLFFVVIGLAFILVGLVWILRTAPLFAGRLRPLSCVRGDVSVCLYMIQYRPQHFRNHQWSNS
jgi:hypothetical protein